MNIRQRAANILRDARDLMNNNGRHWLKGDMTIVIDEYTRGDGCYKISRYAKVGDEVFCAWGAIDHICCSNIKDSIPAMEALVRVISPEAWSRYQQNKVELDRDLQEDYYMNEREYFETLWDSLGNTIACWNDTDSRVWEDVKDAFTKAARSLR